MGVRTVQVEVWLTGKGQQIDVLIPLPAGTARIVAISATCNANDALFPAGAPFVPTPTGPVGDVRDGQDFEQSYWIAIRDNLPHYQKWDAIERTLSYPNGASQVLTLYRNMRTNEDISPEARPADFVLPSEADHYQALGEVAQIELQGRVVQSAPFGLSVPPNYRCVIFSIEASENAQDKTQVLRIGEQVSPTEGTLLGDGDKVELTPAEFATVQLVGIREDETHRVQVQWIL